MTSIKTEGINSSVKHFLWCLLLLSPVQLLFAQLVEFPLASHHETHAYYVTGSRMQSTLPLQIPFWDDFSYSDSLSYPDENLWQYGKSIYLNNGIGIQQPSKNVATFDGVDSVGKPYNVNDILAKGLADKLVSQPIRMDVVDPALRGTVYLSFFYQVKGNGEAPDPGDDLILSFLNADGKWEPVFTIENDGSQDPSTFYQVLVPITDDRFYLAAFQFRLQNYSRLSGPYDTWNVDYIYLNSGRSSSDTSYPDRTVSGSLTSLFSNYRSIPLRHFNPNAHLIKPAIQLYNMRAGNLQPFDYTTSAVFHTKKGPQTTVTKLSLDNKQDPGTILQGQQFLNLTLNSIPPPGAFDLTADSIGIRFRYGMSTKDNVPPALNGDYDASKYSPIDFRVNDSTQTDYTLASYYAYDDGKAEYGAGLNQAGSFLSFKFNMSTSGADTLIYVDIYFPDFADQSVQSLQLEVRSNLTDAPSALLYKQIISVVRTRKNQFTRYKLSQYVILKGEFYIGWKQLATANIPVGLDKNTDNGDKIFYNTNGAWVQNTTVHGSIMVRPGFGSPSGQDVSTGVEDVRQVPVYPNPTRGLCYLPAGATNIVVRDLMGRAMDISVSGLDDRTAVNLPAINGMYIVQYLLAGKLVRDKVMVQAE